MDDTGRFSHKVDLDYSKGSSTRSKPGSKSGQATRHLPPKKKVSGRMAHALGK